MTAFDPLAFLVSLLPVYYGSAFAHELGHALMGKLSGYAVTSFGLGFARPWLVFSLRGTRLFFCRSRPLGGVTFAYWPEIFPPKAANTLLFAGGILANSLLAVLGLALWRQLAWGHTLWITLAGVNGYLALLSLAPYRVRVGKVTLRTDGSLILKMLRSQEISMPAPLTIQSVNALSDLWKATGDVRMLSINRWGLAAAWIELGDFERAEAVVSEALALPEPETPAWRAHADLVRSSLAGGTGRLDEAQAALQSAGTLFGSLRHGLGQLLISIQGAWLQILTGDRTAGLAALDRLSSHPLIERKPSLKLDILARRLLAHTAATEMEAAQKALAEYETMRVKYPSATRDLRVYKPLAALYAHKEDWERAEPTCKKAIAALDELAGAWADESERTRLLERHASFLQEARICLEARNKAEEAERLIGPLESPEKYRARLARAPDLRNQRLLTLGRRLMLVDIGCATCLFAAWWLVGLQAGMELGIVGFEFALFTIVTLLYFAFHFAIGRHIPGLRTSGGGVLLILACLPWLSVIMLPLLLLTQPSR